MSRVSPPGAGLSNLIRPTGRGPGKALPEALRAIRRGDSSRAARILQECIISRRDERLYHLTDMKLHERGFAENYDAMVLRLVVLWHNHRNILRAANETSTSEVNIILQLAGQVAGDEYALPRVRAVAQLGDEYNKEWITQIIAELNQFTAGDAAPASPAARPAAASTASPAAALCTRAKGLMASGRWSEAAKLLSSAISQTSDDPILTDDINNCAAGMAAQARRLLDNINVQPSSTARSRIAQASALLKKADQLKATDPAVVQALRECGEALTRAESAVMGSAARKSATVREEPGLNIAQFPDALRSRLRNVHWAGEAKRRADQLIHDLPSSQRETGKRLADEIIAELGLDGSHDGGGGGDRGGETRII